MENDERGGFILWLSKQALPLRILAFSFFVLLAIGLIFAATGLLYYFNVRNYPRINPIPLVETVTSNEFVTLSDTDAYPAALAVSAEGVVYTGSYVSGAVWSIPSGDSISEIPGSREQIGSVIGIDAQYGLYVLDHLDPLNNGGAKVWRIEGDSLSLVQEITEIVQPNDIAVGENGQIYLSDLAGKIYLLDETGARIWWQAPSTDYAPAGLELRGGELLVSDALRGEIYAIPTDASETEAARIVLFNTDEEVGFNGISLGTNNKLYAADLLNNQVWEIDFDGLVRPIAAYYRGSSNVAYDATTNRLYVNNWDQSWLLPKDFFFLSFNVEARLPFSIDVIEFRN